jgi:16S rRNA processing protein RimM
VNKIYIGKLGKTVGLDGFMKLYIESDFEEQFAEGNSFATNKNETFEIQSYNKKRGIVKFVGMDTIEIAKKYINREIYTTIEDTRKNCKLEKGQYFWFDLEKCEVFEDDKKLGTVKDIQRFANQDYFCVITDENLKDEVTKTAKDFFVPYIDEYIISVDIENKIIKTKGAYDILLSS